MAHAYESRLDGAMSAREFCRRRLARLYPMLFVGLLLGAVTFLARQLQLYTGRLPEGLLIAAISLAMIPPGLFFHTTLFLINPPVWSLFFELVANAAYATPLRHIRGRPGAAILLVVLAILVGFTVVEGSIVRVGPEPGLGFYGGFARIAFSFGLGIALHRAPLYRRAPQIPFWAVAAMLSAALWLMIGPTLVDELACVVVLFPVLLCVGAATQVAGVQSRLCRWLGDVSYPLYLLHQPLLRGLDRLMPHASTFVFGVSSLILTAITAWIVHRFFEKQAVVWLNARLRKLIGA